MDIFCTYEQHFGFSGHPFTTTPDPDFHFESSGHARALDHLRSVVRRSACFAVLTGEAGAGKTVLVRKLLRGLEAESIVAVLPVGTALDERTVLLAILSAFHAPVHDESLEALRERLRSFLDALTVVGRKGLVVFDEAQHLLPEAIGELIRLASPQPDARAALSVLLAGQPELRSRLPRDLYLLREPCFFSCDLGVLGEAETRAYIEHRLRRVLWHQSPVFDEGAYARIHQITGGIPRHVNRLCHRLLMAAAQHQLDEISAPLVDETAAALREELGEVVPAPVETADDAIASVAPAACVRARPGRSAISSLYTPDDQAFASPPLTAMDSHDASPAPNDDLRVAEPADTGTTAELPAEQGAARPEDIAAAPLIERIASPPPVTEEPAAPGLEAIAGTPATARAGWRPGSRTLWVSGGVAVLIFGLLFGTSAYLHLRTPAAVAAADATEDAAGEPAADDAGPDRVADTTPTSVAGNSNGGGQEPATAVEPLAPATTTAPTTATAPVQPDAPAKSDVAAESSATTTGAHSAAGAALPVAAPVIASPRTPNAQTARAVNERSRTARRSDNTRHYTARATNRAATPEHRRQEPRSLNSTPAACTPAVAALGLCAAPRSP